MTTPPPSDPPGRVIRFRPRGSLFARYRPPPPRPEPDLAEYERTQPETSEAYRHRMLVNGLAAAVVVALMIAGWWIADSMARMRKDQDCYLAGRRNCTPIEVPARER